MSLWGVEGGGALGAAGGHDRAEVAVVFNMQRSPHTRAHSDAHRRYKCVRCGSRYCSKRCFTVHTETRCLKFMS